MSKGRVLKDIVMKSSKGSFKPASKLDIGLDKAKAAGKKIKDVAVKNKENIGAAGLGLGAAGATAYALREKKAAKKEPGYWEKQKGIVRASTDGGKKGKGSSYIGVANQDLIKEKLKGTATGAGKGALIGGAGGVALGLAKGMKGGKGKAALLAGALGGLGGALVGSDVGAYKANQKYLKRKGIDSNWMGLSTKFSPEAKKKYIDDYKKTASVAMGKEASFQKFKAFAAKALGKANKSKGPVMDAVDKVKKTKAFGLAQKGYGKAEKVVQKNPNKAKALGLAGSAYLGAKAGANSGE